ncbi:hypothetical protein [Herpetosiphon geysericola]|uniref:SMP-30/Gluconolactonase/LRE-like region domain-containing protein n=1 Tax=Herpetosiphon geysericola TaxID=70996 RepID=A0A0P6Z072_9CHLR|nr:hypothetical protein [Herpetosiphon geysericola]KPL90188.1 hypothetical protein SE18_08260 [Herpetosiphon geysericola]
MRWYYLGILLFGFVSGCASERDRVAPIVIPNVVVTGCRLSPSHNYLIAYIAEDRYEGISDVQIFDLTTIMTITIPLSTTDLDVIPELRWYAADVVLVEQRWLYDIPNGIVTDTTTLTHPLSPSTYNGEIPQWNPSPDGRYVANGSQIWERDPVTGERGTIVIDLPSTPYTTGCNNAWSPDSRSYYFVDWQTVGPRQAEPGPIRKITLP